MIESFTDPRSPSFIAPVFNGDFDGPVLYRTTEQKFYSDGSSKWIATYSYEVGGRAVDARQTICCDSCSHFDRLHRRLIFVTGKTNAPEITKAQFLQG